MVPLNALSSRAWVRAVPWPEPRCLCERPPAEACTARAKRRVPGRALSAAAAGARGSAAPAASSSRVPLTESRWRGYAVRADPTVHVGKIHTWARCALPGAGTESNRAS